MARRGKRERERERRDDEKNRETNMNVIDIDPMESFQRFTRFQITAGSQFSYLPLSLWLDA